MKALDTTFVERALDNKLDAVAAYCDNFRLRYWNEAMERLTEVPRSRAIGASLYDVFPRLRDSAAEDSLRQALGGNQVIGERPFFAASDPTAAHEFEWFVAPLCQEGRVRGGTLIARSLTARGSIAEQMAETEQRFRAMADSSPVLLWMSGRNSLCNFFNSTWLQFSGRSMDQELGVGWAEGVHPEDFETCMNTYMRAFNGRDKFEMEYRLRRHDGDYRWILDRGAPRFSPAGEFMGFIGSCVDITDRKLAEQKTQQLARDLERANDHMERLLYAASHDLREPIRMVVAFMGRLQDHLAGGLDDQARKYLRFANAGAAQMKELVEGLLDFARVRQRAVEMEAVDLAAVMRGVIDDLGLAVEEARADINVAAMPAIRGDRVMLDSLFRNLLGNSLKFRGDQPLRVDISAERIGEEWVVCLADNGIGFEQEFEDQVFQMFRRLHSRDTYAGSGIGLALAKDIVDRHHGRIWAQSRPGEGSRFFVALPERAPGT